MLTRARRKNGKKFFHGLLAWVYSIFQHFSGSQESFSRR